MNKITGLGEKTPKPPEKGAIHPIEQQRVFWQAFINNFNIQYLDLQ
jgi:hypothetical protein